MLATPPPPNRRLRAKVKHLVCTMLCCGRRKVPDPREHQTVVMACNTATTMTSTNTVSPRRTRNSVGLGTGGPPEMVIQSDFRKVSGISTEIFNQLQAVENDHDAQTAASIEAVERRGEMVIRLLDIRAMGKVASEAAKRFLSSDSAYQVRFVEIVKRPGQTLGLYIREGDGLDRMDGVFVSRIALESAVYNSGCLHVGDEILAVNFVDVTCMGLDDVVIIMSIPRRLVLTTRSLRHAKGSAASPPSHLLKPADAKGPPVVVFKKDFNPDDQEQQQQQQHQHHHHHSNDGMMRESLSSSSRSEKAARTAELDSYLYYNSQPQAKFKSSSSTAAMSKLSPKRVLVSADWTHNSESGTLGYQPISTMSVVSEQPRTTQAYPKTLESLAEKVHSFYGGSPGGDRVPYATATLGRRPLYRHPSATSVRQLQPCHSERTLVRRGSIQGPHGSAVASSLAGGIGDFVSSGRLLRAESDQRIWTSHRDYDQAYWSRTLRSSLKPSTAVPSMQVQRPQHSTSSMSYLLAAGSAGGRYAQTLQRLGALRRRAAADSSCSDTEVTAHVPRSATSSSYLLSSRGGGGGSRQSSLESRTARFQAQGRSNSLPRMRVDDQMNLPRPGGRHRPTVHFERDLTPTLLRQPQHRRHRHQHHDYDSDGALSAPELPSIRRSRGSRIPSSPSVFTSAEYRAWISRAPSTSAIYEKLHRSRRTAGDSPSSAAARRSIRFTYSAENLSDLHRPLLEDHPYRLYHGLYCVDPALRVLSNRSSVGGHADVMLPPSQRFRLMLDEGRPIPQPSPAKASESRLRLVDINPAEFHKYKPERNSAIVASESTAASKPSEAVSAPETVEPTVSRSFGGLLWVHLLAGRGLRSPAARTTEQHYRDLYCVLECDRVHKARTVVRTGDQNFDWDETFELDLVDNKELDFLVYSWDPQSRHKLCFRGSVQMAALLLSGDDPHQLRHHHQIALKVEPRGTLYMKLRYAEPRQVFKRIPALSVTSTRKKGNLPTPLFGSDLESVIAREQSGFSVPILVKRCLEEVERRGLDIIGLYRLCGSASKKRLLREAFERNPRLVDLSPDNVPDINVITGVLKDYLRELPEPLFTACLYQMMVDALAVCLPDDPEGNAKLMFSILECLPKINRFTLLILMDHLKLVVSQSERNKMTAQNLATCFGPVLFVQTDGTTNTLDFQKPIRVLKYLLEIWPSKSVVLAHEHKWASRSCSSATLASAGAAASTAVSEPTAPDVPVPQVPLVPAESIQGDL